MPKIQRTIKRKLLKIYNGAERCCLEKNKELFYDELSRQIIESACATGNVRIALKQYEMSVSSYLESKLIDFNISVVTLLLMIVTGIKIGESFIEASLFIVLILVLVLGLGIRHVEKQKLLEIEFVLKNINEKYKELT